MKYLITRTDQYRCDTEEEANEFLDTLRQDKTYDIISTTVTQKAKKQKGEIIDSWVRLVVKKKYNDEAEPETDINFAN